MPGMDALELRAARHAALGDPVRLRIVDELALSDRAPVELRRRSSNLLWYLTPKLVKAIYFADTTSSRPRTSRK